MSSVYSNYLSVPEKEILVKQLGLIRKFAEENGLSLAETFLKQHTENLKKNIAVSKAFDD